MHVAWWAGKWSQHSIEVGPSSNASLQTALDTLQVTRQYVWQRFIELSQARSPYPIKFNGMLYGAKRPPNTDLNLWGGLNWWQNLRMPYYNMLPSGDFDEVKTLFASFNQTVPIARQRTKSQFGFDGIWWPEYTHVFYGTPHPGGQGLRNLGYRALFGCVAQTPGVKKRFRFCFFENQGYWWGALLCPHMLMGGGHSIRVVRLPLRSHPAIYSCLTCAILMTPQCTLKEPDWHSDDEWNGYEYGQHLHDSRTLME